MIVVARLKVRAPSGATHYSGNLADRPTWWKYQINSTGAIAAWYYWNRYGETWQYHRDGCLDTPPHKVQKIEEINEVPCGVMDE